MIKSKNDKVIEKACELISLNLGETTAGYYKEFYKNKNPELIMLSLEEVLSELVGIRNSKKQIKEIKNFLK